jgi:hypothetical protein
LGVDDDGSEIDAKSVYEWVMRQLNIRRVTKEDIESYFAREEADAKSRGGISRQFDEDLRSGYAEYEGDMNELMRSVPMLEDDTREAAERHLWSLIAKGELPDFERFHSTAKFSKEERREEGGGEEGSAKIPKGKKRRTQNKKKRDVKG